MSEGIKDKEELKEEEEDGDDAINAEDLDRISVNPPVRRESKKTRTQRNKEKKKKMQVCWGFEDGHCLEFFYFLIFWLFYWSDYSCKLYVTGKRFILYV